jgi:arylsulfate sulfotransferase
MIAAFSTLRAVSVSVIACAALALVGCGLSTSQGTDPPADPVQPQASSSSCRAARNAPGVTPFTSFVNLVCGSAENLAAIEFTISPRSGSVSKPVHVRYAMEALQRQGDVTLTPPGVRRTGFWVVRVPVFGLYAGFQNQVSMQLDFQDASTVNLGTVIETAPYSDPNGIYDHVEILKNRSAGTDLGFDFFLVKSMLGSPVIIDTDGAVRWVGGTYVDAMATAIVDGGFVTGDQSSPTLFRLGFDGSFNRATLADSRYTNFHHNIDYGKQGLLAEVDANVDGVKNLETTVIELRQDVSIVNSWDLAAILSAYMRSQGDDPSAFVRSGVDWFHMNATTYDPSDDSLIVSSRENFLIKLDYSTGRIVWILGDPTKYWYTFPSLRAKALTLQAGGLYPIGQHAVSITPDGLVMVFNDGAPSANQPPGAPPGQSRTYSAVSAYSIDSTSGTAQEVWRFDYGQSIYSPYCSSAYEVPGGSVLVSYATAANFTEARLVGLDAAHNVVFDFQYPNSACNTSWNAIPIALEDLAIN